MISKLIGLFVVFGFVLPASLVSFLWEVALLQLKIFRGNLHPGGRHVVITGGDSGFGLMTALALDKLGYNVMVTCLGEEKVKELKEKCSSKFNAFVCDVTKQCDVDAFVGECEKWSNGHLFALINNAGVLNYGPVEWVPMSHYERDMAVNYFGTVRMTKALLPFLRHKKNSRIVNVASVAGTVSTGLIAPYSASKYAVEAFSDSLRRELAPFNIDVVIVEPSIMKTAMLNDFDGFSNLFENLNEKTKEAYGTKYSDEALKIVRGWKQNSSNDPSLVVNTLVTIMSTTYPAIRYKVGWDAKTTFVALAALPSYLQDCCLSLFVPMPKPHSKFE